MKGLRMRVKHLACVVLWAVVRGLACVADRLRRWADAISNTQMLREWWGFPLRDDPYTGLPTSDEPIPQLAAEVLSERAQIDVLLGPPAPASGALPSTVPAPIQQVAVREAATRGVVH